MTGDGVATGFPSRWVGHPRNQVEPPASPVSRGEPEGSVPPGDTTRVNLPGRRVAGATSPGPATTPGVPAPGDAAIPGGRSSAAAPKRASPAQGSFQARLRAGEAGALHDLAVEWGPRLYRYAVRLGADGELARDLTQEALVRVVRAVREGRGPDHLGPWLYRIMTNLVRDEARSAYRQRVELAETPEDGAAPWWNARPGSLGADPADLVTGRYETRDRSRRLRAALDALAPPLREVVVLRVLEQRPVPAVAAILGVAEGTVKSRLHRALKALRRALEPASGGASPWEGVGAGRPTAPRARGPGSAGRLPGATPWTAGAGKEVQGRGQG